VKPHSPVSWDAVSHLKEEIVIEMEPGLSGIERMTITFPVPVLTFLVVPQLSS